MTKTCLRLLFLALAAVPLAHGCGDSSIECLGTPVACQNRELADCNAGCRSYQGCLGGTITCDLLTSDSTLCRQTGDCRFVGSCEGAEGCGSIDFDVCTDTPGCVEVRRCSGTSVTCASLGDDQCELYPQCRLDAECRGSAAPCNDLASRTACSDVPGCFPADTEPSVVD
jgi:hypothetical protein